MRESIVLQAQLALAGLRKLAEDGPKEVELGICGNLEDLIEELPEYNDAAMMVLGTDYVPDWLDDLLQPVFGRWPLWSGSYNYPVPHPTMGCISAFSGGGLWDQETAYGTDRWNLLHFLITYFEEQLAGEQQ